MKRTLPGLNIQFPISSLIVNGTKTIETRTYPLPRHYIGVDLALIETPGKSKEFKARIIAIIRFGEPFKYKTKKEFYADVKNHFVDEISPWAWTDEKGKWGWPVTKVKKLAKPIMAKQPLGIKFTKDIQLEG